MTNQFFSHHKTPFENKLNIDIRKRSPKNVNLNAKEIGSKSELANSKYGSPAVKWNVVVNYRIRVPDQENGSFDSFNSFI